MKLIKEKIPLKERIYFLIESFQWFTVTYIPTYDSDLDEWYYEYHSWRDRLSCWWSEFTTAILGYYFGVK